MADPVIGNVPASIPADQVSFFQSMKSALEFMMGHGRYSDQERALRVNELAKAGLDVSAFLKSSSKDPYLFSSATSNRVPKAPSGLTIVKGAFTHTLKWTNPADVNVSHIEVWGVRNSQDISDADRPIGIVTVTPDLRGKEGLFINSGLNVSDDWTYWIRSYSFGQKYSEWHPSLVQGGITVQGDETLAETIDDVIEVLNGGLPEIYDPGYAYQFNERCRDSGGRVWVSEFLGDNQGNTPPAPGYWKRSGILMQGDVDGVPTIAVDGNLVVDGTILADAIAASQIKADHIDTNEIFVGMTIQSSNFVAGVSGWKIDQNGDFEIYGGSIHLGPGSTGYQNLDDTPDVSANWSGTEVPTLENAPAVNWATEAARAEHLDDTYLRDGKEIYQFAILQRTPTGVVLSEIINAVAGTNSITGREYIASAVSTTSYTGECLLEFSIDTITAPIVCGLSQNPTADNDPDSIEFGFRFVPGTMDTIQVIESGTTTLISDDVDIDPSDLFSVYYDGTDVKYYKDRVLVHTSIATVPGSATFLVDSFLAGEGDEIFNIVMGPETFEILDPPTPPSVNLVNSYDTNVGSNYVEAIAFSGYAYSTTSYTGECFVEFTSLDTSSCVLLGLSQNPTANENTADIDFGIYIYPGWPQASVLEYGSLVSGTDIFESITSTTVWSISYDGSFVRYYKDRELFWTSEATIPSNATFHIAIELTSMGDRADNIAFGPGVFEPEPPVAPSLVNILNTSVGSGSITSLDYLASAVSTTSYTGECLLEFSIDTITAPIVCGLSQNPTADNDPDSIEFGWEFTPVSPATIRVIESGTKTLISDDVDIDPEDRFAIHYDGTDIKYYKSQTLAHTSTATVPASATFLVDSHLLAPADEIAGISFWPEAWDYYDPYYGWKLTATNDSDIRSPNDDGLLDPELIDPSRSLIIGDIAADFCQMTSGELNFYQLIDGAQYLVKSLKRMDEGTAESGTWKTLPGRWASQPSVMVSPSNITSFDPTYVNQPQKLRLEVTDVEEVLTGQWRFKPVAYLEIGPGSGTASPDLSATSTSSVSSAAHTPLANTRSVSAVIKAHGWYNQNNNGDSNAYRVNIQVRLAYYYSGAWYYTSWTSTQSSYQSWVTWTVTTPTVGADITSIYAQAQISSVGSYVGDPGYWNLGYHCTVLLDTITIALAGGSVLATGAVNYRAIA